MDKKKVIRLIEKTVAFTKATEEDYIHGTVKRHIVNVLRVALSELSKPDWISVEDELPPYKEDVIVCNNLKPKKVWMAYRSERDYFKKDDNDFVLHGDYEPSITHWRKIDKLEV